MSLRDFTLHDQLARNAQLHGERLAFVTDSQRITHGQLAERAAALAGGLAAVGVGVGDRVAVLAYNGQEYVDLLGAAAMLGAILVPVNWRLTAEEIAHVLRDTAPRVLIASPELCALVSADDRAASRAYVLGASADTNWRPASELYGGSPLTNAAAIDANAGLVIIHTAAVGGRSRGALLAHTGLLAAAEHAKQAWNLTPDDVNVGVLPLFHIAGIAQMLALLVAGGATILERRFDAKRVVQLIDEEGGSVLGSFPPMLGAVLTAAAEADSTLAPLRVVSGIESPPIIARLQAACPQVDFWVGYGQTETTGMVTMARFADCPGSAGRPVAQHVVAVVDECDRPVPLGTVGEITVRGPMVFQGYWGREDDNADIFRGGCHHTGDLGRFDADGFLWYAGRSSAKTLIKPGGENVYPAEVEQVLLEHPGVAEAVVFGVADEQWGEAIKAVCVMRDGHELSAEALIEFVGARIARYKKPRHVVFVPAIPKDSTGVPDRAAVAIAHGAPHKP